MTLQCAYEISGGFQTYKKKKKSQKLKQMFLCLWVKTEDTELAFVCWKCL